VTSWDSRRRKRRIALLLSAILVPTAVVIFLVVRVVHQESELSERRIRENRREAHDQLRRELSARLQAIRVEEVNRLIGETGTKLPADSPIVFVAPIVQDRMLLPWDDRRPVQLPSAEFARNQASGEFFEFQSSDPKEAAAEYQRALSVARTPAEKCAARLWLGRAFAKAEKIAEAQRSDQLLIQECGSTTDADGIPFGLYAAERLLATSRDKVAADYVLQRTSVRHWRSANEVYLLQSLRPETRDELTTELRDMQQIEALSQDLQDHLGRLQQAFRSAPGDLSWIGYGTDPWLITVVSPTSFATPVVMAVSSRKVLPQGVSLHAGAAPDSAPLGDGFVDLHLTWAPGRFAVPQQFPLALYGSALFLVLGATLLTAWLLLRDVHREAETAALRSLFVASVSHELKTPLTSIRASAETLLMDRAESKQAASEYLKTIVSESERLTRLVESVLDLSRIEMGRKTYRMQSTCLHEVVRSAAKAMEYPLSQLGFVLTISDDETKPRLLADSDALEQAILNLLGNAIKYSGSGRSIEMRVGSHNAEAFVDVVDHGIGISRDDQALIFEKFHRVRSAETEGIAGTGLGLALALHVAEAHKGRIDVVSNPGHGSTFSLRLPLQEQA
jgi:signal transduction histidine kinase